MPNRRLSTKRCGGKICPLSSEEACLGLSDYTGSLPIGDQPARGVGVILAEWANSSLVTSSSIPPSVFLPMVGWELIRPARAQGARVRSGMLGLRGQRRTRRYGLQRGILGGLPLERRTAAGLIKRFNPQVWANSPRFGNPGKAAWLLEIFKLVIHSIYILRWTRPLSKHTVLSPFAGSRGRFVMPQQGGGQAFL